MIVALNCRISTHINDSKHLTVIADQSHGVDRLNQQQPVGTTHDFTPGRHKGREVEIRLDRYQNRIMGDNVRLLSTFRSFANTATNVASFR